MRVKERLPGGRYFGIGIVYICCVFKGFVSFVSLDVVYNELRDCVRYVGVYKFVNEFMCIHSDNYHAHIRCYNITVLVDDVTVMCLLVWIPTICNPALCILMLVDIV